MASIKASILGKRNRTKSAGEDDLGSKRIKFDLKDIMGDISILNRSRIYNYGIRKKPAELFRKDLISAMKMADSEQLHRNDYLPITEPWREEWEKGVQVPVNPDILPQSRYGEANTALFKETDVNSTSDAVFKMPKKLLKFDPERDAAASKYEIDLTDHCWMESLNEGEEGMGITTEFFEEVMNEIEHNCARNMKAKHVGIEYDDHIICEVCRSPDAEDGNEMVFCDSCNICVHQACYGITIIPDGEWLCAPCTKYGSHSPSKKTVACVLCPNLGGAFKPTSNGKWSHVSCALWVPEVSIGCVTTMEPITKVKQIPPSRWNLICNLCSHKAGAPIQCSIKTCKTAYHVTCAFKSNLRMRAIVENNSKGVKLKSYCPKHSEKDDSEKNCDEIASNHRLIEIATSQSETDKNNRFWMYIDINEINQTFVAKQQELHQDLSSQAIQLYIDLILQYWKMKRTSNFGLPLIKVVTPDTIEEIQTQTRYDIMKLRVNLERIRNLSYMICRREKIKRSWFTTHREIVEKSLGLLAGKSPAKKEDEPINNIITSSIPPLHHTDRIGLASDLLNINNIYEPSTSEAASPKKVVRDLNRLVKVERTRRIKTNPYAKYYNGHQRIIKCMYFT